MIKYHKIVFAKNNKWKNVNWNLLIRIKNAFLIKQSIEQFSKTKSILNAIIAKINSKIRINENHLHDVQSIIVFNFASNDKFNLNEAISNDDQQRNQTDETFYQLKINFKTFLFDQKFFHVKISSITIVSSSSKLNTKRNLSYVIASINVEKNDKTFVMYQKNKEFSKIIVILTQRFLHVAIFKKKRHNFDVDDVLKHRQKIIKTIMIFLMTNDNDNVNKWTLIN